jgi:hypothetical protein
MIAVAKASSDWCRDLVRGWDTFWFTPSAPQTLAAIRILAGTMLLYTHFVWSLDLVAFLGTGSWVSPAAVQAMQGDSWTWSYLSYIESPTVLWTAHLAALAVFALLTVGLWTRVTSILAAIITVSYCHRLPGALFGLDQINAMLAMYLAVGPSGMVYSVDSWRKSRSAQRKAVEGATTQTAKHEAAKHPAGSRIDRPLARGTNPAIVPAAAWTNSVGVTIAIRLMQLHLCVVYLFGGIGKMRGEMWWDGSAVWYAVANLEYQSLDMTWLVHFPWLVALLTHVTVFWETFYPFLIWPPRTRPLMLIMAVLVHGGIALFLGMPTFGLAMLIANLAFVSPATVDRILGLCPRLRRN